MLSEERGEAIPARRCRSLVSAMMAIKTSRVGLWNRAYRQGGPRRMYSDDRTARMGARFLNAADIHEVEDWGCGWGGFKDHLAPHQKYIGIDGSKTPCAARIVDLEEYTSRVDGIFLRHVLDHNFAWEQILENAIGSFVKRMVVVLFTPFGEKTRILREYPEWGGTTRTMIDMSFRRQDLTRHFGELLWSSVDNIETPTQYGVEHVFYLEKKIADGA